MDTTAPQSPDSITPPAAAQVQSASRPNGRLWTLAAAVIVFSWILWTISSFLFQRLSGEPVSPTCSLEFRQINPDNHLPESLVLLTATDFQSFRGVPGKDGECRLILTFSTRGMGRLQDLKKLPPSTELAVLVAGNVIAALPVTAAVSDQPLEFVLTGVSASDANEIFARLTE